MRIGFDAKRYFNNSSGLGNYSRDLVNSLQKFYTQNEYLLFSKNNLKSLYGAYTMPAPNITNPFWRTYGMVKNINDFDLQIFHGLSNELPWGKWNNNIQKIVTIHDVIFKLFPSYYSLIDRNIYNIKTKHAIQIADKIIATSKATAHDLIKHYNCNPEKIKVVYQTCHSAHWQNYSTEQIDSFIKDKQLPERYLLYVSSFQQRKNHIKLIKAFSKVTDTSTHLVLAGHSGNTLSDCVQLVKELNLQKRVHFITSIKTTELPLLYRGAISFVYPSKMEGFGIPLIEAACAGLPIAYNNIPVFNEIAPTSALPFDENIEHSFSQTIIQLANMPKMNYQEHLHQFTPESCAQRTMEVYELRV